MTGLPVLSLHEALAKVSDMSDLPSLTATVADTRDGRVYVTTDDVVRAVKVALVTGRPLLLGGPPGTGKSSLASYVARNLGVPYYEYVAVDDSRPADLLWNFDAVRRLADAQVGSLRSGAELDQFERYIMPGPLWWALDRESAAQRGLSTREREAAGVDMASDPAIDLGHAPSYQGAVVLIDEVDKADNAFSNGLLVPLGARQFDIPPLARRVAATSDWAPLVIISTNNERSLSAAFLRRCVTLALPVPDVDQLVAIAERHLGPRAEMGGLREAVRTLASTVAEEGDASAAEFLDLVRVLAHTEDFDVESEEWQLIRRLVLDRRPLDGRRLL